MLTKIRSYDNSGSKEQHVKADLHFIQQGSSVNRKLAKSELISGLWQLASSISI
jgi:hypothetical protein